MTFQIHALPRAPFEPLLGMNDAELSARRACWRTADAEPGYPCRVSLEDAKAGERLLLANFEHLGEQSPFRASHAVFVRPGAKRARPEPDTIPDAIRRRLISVRGFDADWMMLAADMVDGDDLAATINAMFANTDIAELHLHAAKPGCYLARVTRD
ncbi:MAG: DUF1203 domain-containing protein [Roseitalea sp.]|nr:DUF1203 domain-containing protein [Roseitalea sp.]MBO6743216.1 DUF1203 domain-containing protein [Roseitalea sp.]